MDADEWREDEEDDALNRGERCAAEDFAEHDGRAAHRRGEHREQEAFVAVLDERHHAEDGGEEDDHGDRAGEEVAEVMAGYAASPLPDDWKLWANPEPSTSQKIRGEAMTPATRAFCR